MKVEIVAEVPGRKVVGKRDEEWLKVIEQAKTLKKKQSVHVELETVAEVTSILKFFKTRPEGSGFGVTTRNKTHVYITKVEEK